MKLKKTILPLLALLMLAIAAIPPVMAYFTTYTRAKGGYTIHQSTNTTIEEDFQNWQKIVTIANREGKAVFVRARAYAGSDFTLNYSGEGWSDGGDGWWYYAEPVEAGSAARELYVSISNLPMADEGLNFNVAVVYESTPALYDAGGKASADWSMILDQGGEQA